MTARVIQPFGKDGETHGYMFHCPGCKYGHAFYVVPTKAGKGWTFNGDLEKPTFSPSLHVQPRAPKNPKYRRTLRCHLFLRNGVLQFLNDCEHELAGKHVPLEVRED